MYLMWAMLGRGQVTGCGSDPVWGSEFPGLTAKPSSPDSSSSTQPTRVWLAWPSGGCVPSFWVRASLTRAWIC